MNYMIMFYGEYVGFFCLFIFLGWIVSSRQGKLRIIALIVQYGLSLLPTYYASSIWDCGKYPKGICWEEVFRFQNVQREFSRFDFSDDEFPLMSSNFLLLLLWGVQLAIAFRQKKPYFPHLIPIIILLLAYFIFHNVAT